ncbi:histidine kinase [Leptospira langatensis]|uniref:histidine kinase n=1 Tax=Leptospira langatensis TaxID=2484983 RepID=A0A5F1ZV43_9LEPT|nr:ATP-binding protein [Leptospira langatensis]TGK00296.1 histidine kinase [Leptospira langatensis]TGL41068.1 histidine kinase [Leptospira langatensis]
MNSSVSALTIRSSKDRNLGFFFLYSGFVFVLILFAFIYFTNEAKLLRIFDNIHWTTSIGFAAIVSWFGYRSSEGEVRRYRFWFFLGLLSYFVGQVVWDIQVLTQFYSFPAPSDVFYPWLGPCFVLGFARVLKDRVPSNRMKVAVMDAIGLSIAVLAVTLVLYLSKKEDRPWLQLLALAVYPVFMLSAASVAVLMQPSLRIKISLSYLCLVAGLAGTGISWLQWNSIFLIQVPADGTLTNAGFSASILLLAYSALTWEPDLSALRKNTGTESGLLRILPLLEVIVCSAAIVLSLTLPGLPEIIRLVIWFCAGVMVVIASLRQSLLVSDLAIAEKVIRNANEALEITVSERTEELRSANQYLVDTNEKLRSAMSELKKAQENLVQSEKMAVLGRLIAGIAHELNTPLGAIRSSTEGIRSILNEPWEDLIKEYAGFTKEEKEVWATLFKRGGVAYTDFDSKEERKKRKLSESVLADAGFLNAHIMADILTDMGNSPEQVKEILQKLPVGERGWQIVNNASALSSISRSSQLILDASVKASRVIQALKSYAAGEGDWRPQVESVSPKEQIENIITLYYSKIKNKVLVDIQIPDEARIQGDSERLYLVWTNLITNAFHSMNYSGRIFIDATLQDDDYWEISIQDTGSGISDEIKDRVFDPFFTTKSPGEGTGLGLDICKNVVEEHRGKIHFTTTDSGTTFYVLLPAFPEAKSV